jgi:hypothetical protein
MITNDMIGRAKKFFIRSNRVTLFCGFVACTAAISLLFHPRVQLASVPFSREQHITSFITSTHDLGGVDTLLLWQLRDLYGSGTFTVAPDHTIFRESQELVIQPRDGWIHFATYKGQRVESIDSFTEWSSTPAKHVTEFLDEISEAHVGDDRLLFQNESTRIYLQDQNTLIVAFVKPIEEMTHVFGIYNFPTKTLELLHGRLWAERTVFTLDCCTNLHSSVFSKSK